MRRHFKVKYLLVSLLALLAFLFVYQFTNSPRTFANVIVGGGGGTISASGVAAAECNSQGGYTGTNASNRGPNDYEAFFTCQANYLNDSSYTIWEAPNANGNPDPITVSWNYTCSTGAENGHFTPINGSISGRTLATGCNDNNMGYSSPVYNLTITPNSCNAYNNTMCQVVLKFIGDPPSSNDTYLGGRIYSNISNISSNAGGLSIKAGAANNGSTDPANGAGYSITASGLGGVTKTIRTSQGWSGGANQATLSGGSLNRTFQADCTYSGTAYIGWEGSVYGMGGNNTNSNGGNGSYINPLAANASAGFHLEEYEPDGTDAGPVTLNVNGNNMTNVSGKWLYGGNDDTGSSAQAIDDMNTPYSARFTVKAGWTYKWVWNGVYTSQYNVPITESIPYPENPNDLGLQCWTLVHHSEVSQTGTNSYQFNHEVGNNGPYQASYTWKVQGCYYTNNNTSYCNSTNNNPDADTNWYKDCSGDTNSDGIDTNQGANYCGSHSTLPLNSNEICSPPSGNNSPPNYCPDYAGNKAMVNYTFPSSAKLGDGYCQRIYATDIDGPDDKSVGASTEQCGTYAGASDIDAKTSVSPTSVSSYPPTATFTHTVSVNGSANFSYQVEGAYCSGGAAFCNSYGVTGCGSQAPGCPTLPGGSKSNQTTNYSFTYTYTFPSSAQSGDEYCQRLYVNPGNNTVDNPNAGVGNGGDMSSGGVTIDGSTGWYNDGGTCTTYSPPNFDNSGGACYEMYGTIPKGSSYNQQYTTDTHGEYGLTAPATSGRYSTADIYISSNGGSTSAVQYRPDSHDSQGGNGQDYTSYPTTLSQGASYDYTYYPNGTSVSYSENDYVTVSYKSVTGTANVLTGYDKNGNPQYTQETVTQPAYTYTFFVGTVNSGTSPCYSGGCTINSVNYGAFSIEGQQYTVNVTFYNNGPQILMNNLYYNSGGPQIGYSYGATGSTVGGGTGYLSSSGYDGLTQGQSTGQISITLTAGSGAHYETPTIQLEYIGANGFTLGSACTPPPPTTTVDVYEPFNLSLSPPTISLSPSNEDPTSVNYSTQICNSANVAVNASSTSYAYETPSTGGRIPLIDDGTYVSPPPIPASGCMNPIPINTSEGINPLLASAGDQYCDSIQANYTTGYVGAGGPGDLQGTQTSASQGPSCAIVQNEPYVQAFGNDVIGDAAFSGKCGSSGDIPYSGIYTYSHGSNSGADSSPRPTGSYTQFGAQALGVIEGFSSAALRPGGNLPTGSMGLSFSNTTDNTGGNSDAANLGGGFGPSMCEPDYYSEKPATGTTPYTTSSIASIGASGNYNFTAGSGSDTTQISSPNPYSPLIIPQGVKVAIFVNGNAYIDSNIIFAGATTGWSNIKQIPSLYIIATGNIYIDPSVSQLDGVYIAEPNPSGASTGIIDTCANVSGPYQVTSLYGDDVGCDQQLTVNGAFVDQATMLDRTFSSLRFSQAGENPQTPAHGCGALGQEVYSGGPTSAPSCAAEVFNFSPEIYISQPAYNPLPKDDEYITSLSPVL